MAANVRSRPNESRVFGPMPRQPMQQMPEVERPIDLKMLDSDVGALALHVLQNGFLGHERANGFKSVFGVTAVTFRALIHKVRWSNQLTPRHVLIGLCWLKSYPTEHTMRRLSGYACRKIIRQYVRKVVDCLCAHLPYVVSTERKWTKYRKGTCLTWCWHAGSMGESLQKERDFWPRWSLVWRKDVQGHC